MTFAWCAVIAGLFAGYHLARPHVETYWRGRNQAARDLSFARTHRCRR